MAERSQIPARRAETVPADPLGALHREMNRLFDDFSRGFPWQAMPGWATGGATRPLIDVDEDENGTLTVTAELPGIDEKDVEVQLNERALVIRGEKRYEHEEKKKERHLMERSFGSFSRTIGLPFEADPDKVTASFDKGILKVTVPRPAEANSKSRKIEVKKG